MFSHAVTSSEKEIDLSFELECNSAKKKIVDAELSDAVQSFSVKLKLKILSVWQRSLA